MTKSKNSAEKKYGIYVHIPFCKSKCSYCAFVSTPEIGLQQAYVNTLINEIRSSDARAVDSIYIGGGTPSCLYRGALGKIFDALRSVFDIDDNAEITVEANPESCKAEFVDEIRSCGVNRVSMGLQSSDDKILRAIGRVHTLSDFTAALKTLERGGIENISSDLILGLPDQNCRDIANALDIICDSCSHASVYALSVEEGTPLFKSGYSPDDDIIAEMYDLAVERLYLRGFSRYEVSNFSRPTRQSKHNMKYWKCLPYIGFGAAAHGYDGEYTRYAHSDDICKYIDDPRPTAYSLSEKDRYNEYVMLALRTEYGLNFSDFSARFGYDFEDTNKDVLNKLVSQGLVERSQERIGIAFDKMFVMNGIIEELMI